jgi:hypothetical protein
MTTPKEPAPKPIRLTVNINEATAEAMKVSAKRSGVTVTETLRRAVAMLKYIEGEVDAGRMILTRDSDGRRERELVVM